MPNRFPARFFIVSLTALSLAVTTLTPTHAGSVMDLLPGGGSSKGYLGFDFSERQPGYGENVSIISSNLPSTPSTTPSTYLCSSISDANVRRAHSSGRN